MNRNAILIAVLLALADAAGACRTASPRVAPAPATRSAAANEASAPLMAQDEAIAVRELLRKLG
jgi:hypothetical protein